MINFGEKIPILVTTVSRQALDMIAVYLESHFERMLNGVLVWKRQEHTCRRDMTEQMLKTALNPNQSINQLTFFSNIQ